MTAGGQSRIGILDGFRTAAISPVIAYHYYVLWAHQPAPSGLYPYGDQHTYFSYGYLGVEFFFIISGFVIAYTLQRTPTMWQFLRHRFVRLFPALLVCTTITFLFCRAMDTEWLFPRAHSIRNLLYSFTFLSPMVAENDWLRHLHLNYVSGSYWSLWPEVQFYLMAAVLYFLSPKKFTLNFLLLGICLWLVSATNVSHSFLDKMFTIFNLGGFLPWFICGVTFYEQYANPANKPWKVIVAVGVLLIHTSNNWHILVAAAGMLVLFVLLFRKPGALQVFQNRLITRIGRASYGLYLIHEVIGVLLIHHFAAGWGRADFLFPVAVCIVMICFSLLLYRYVEKPLSILWRRNSSGRTDQ